MNAARRTTTLLVVFTVFALAAAGCGVKAKDGIVDGTGGGSTETTTPDDTTTEPSDEPADTTEPSDEPADTTEPSDDPTDTTIPDFGDFGRDSLVELYTDMGLSEEQATCLVDAIFDSATAGDIDPNDQSAIFDYLATCEIDITDFGGTGSGG